MIACRRAWTLIALLASACTSQEPALPVSNTVKVPDLPDALVELPSVDLDSSPPSPDASATEIAVGGWDWGAPCRVRVHELVGGAGPQISRTFTIDLAADPTSDGLVMAFDDIDEELRGMTEQAVAQELARYVAVLPTARLDRHGRFVEFVDLDSSFAALAERAGGDVVPTDASVTETVLDRTILGWFGFWLDDENLPANPTRTLGQRVRHLGAAEYRATTERFAATEVGDGAWGPQTDDKVWFSYIERIAESPTVPTGDDLLLTERVDVSAIMDPARLRPSYVSITIGGSNTAASPAGSSTVYAFSDRRIVKFDWDHAEGCE